MKNKKKIPTILAILVLSISIASGVLLIQSKNIFKLGADETVAPQNVRITNINDSSFTVSWTSKKETAGFIMWGKSPSSLENTEGDEIGKSGYLHYVSVQGLNPSKTYYFKINSQGVDFDNDGTPWKVNVPQKLANSAVQPISGTILTATGEPAAKVLVYLNIGGASPLSTVTSDNGSWVISLSDLRTSNLNSFYSLNEEDTIELSVQAGPLGISSAQIHTSSARPTPPLILGQTHDFRNLPPTSTDSLPEAEVNAPESFEKTSKFNVPDTISISKTDTVTLINPEDGEIINTEKPEFFGEGPPGTEITITVESEPVTDGVTVENSGGWKWSPPSDLEPGSHKVTISYKDENGILQTLTKSFIIQAAEAPSFESTPSASPIISPTPSVSPSPTASASPSSTATGTAIPQPESGITAPTWIFIILGIALVLGGTGLGTILTED